MAKSPAHKFGQLIGNLSKELIEPFLEEFANKNGLYLDYQQKPREARSGSKVTWKDPYGNNHVLDYVLERDGSADNIGTPVAFIEVAWRRYTKHSRNKVQEIQGAVLPIAEKFEWSNPFLGAVLAGVFTESSIEQLRSLGFHVLYFPYETIIEAFSSQGIDVTFDEDTPDEDFGRRVKTIESASDKKMQKVKMKLGNLNNAAIYRFMASLKKRLDRMINRVVVVPLYGRSSEFSSVGEALKFIDHHCIREGDGAFKKYEVLVSFTNGDKVEGSFVEKEKACEFLKFVAGQ